MHTSLYPRGRPLISPTHKGPIVNLVGWVVLVTSALAVLTVLVSKLLVVRKLGLIDAILTCALVGLILSPLRKHRIDCHAALCHRLHRRS